MRSIEELTPRMVRVTLGGGELEGLEVAQPAASVRLLIPFPSEPLVIPTWTGNEFLAMSGDKEEGVVDADAEADHRTHLRSP